VLLRGDRFVQEFDGNVQSTAWKDYSFKAVVNSGGSVWKFWFYNQISGMSYTRDGYTAGLPD
jgi:hypothetical protein